jgi:hypothetical protein
MLFESPVYGSFDICEPILFDLLASDAVSM